MKFSWFIPVNVGLVIFLVCIFFSEAIIHVRLLMTDWQNEYYNPLTHASSGLIKTVSK